MRVDQGSHVTTAITEQLIQVEKDLRNGEDEMLEFQKENNIGFIQERRKQRRGLPRETQPGICPPEDRIRSPESARSRPKPRPAAGRTHSCRKPPVPPSQTKACLLPTSVRKANTSRRNSPCNYSRRERDTLSKDLRPRHPKIIRLNDEIDKQENLIRLYRQDAVEKLDTRRKSIGKQMENLKSNIKEWEKKALDLSQRLAQFNRLKDKVDRQKTLYDRLTNNLKDVNVSQVVDGGDQVGIMEKRDRADLGATRV